MARSRLVSLLCLTTACRVGTSRGDDPDPFGETDPVDTVVGDTLDETGVHANRPPRAAVVRITPRSPTTDDDLRCDLVGGHDPDGDPTTPRFAWYRDGALVGDRVGQPTVPASTTTGYERWTCVAVLSDGVLDGPPGEDAVAIDAADRCRSLKIASGSRVDVPYDPAFELVGSDLTLEGWVFLEDEPTAGRTAGVVRLNTRAEGGSPTDGWRFLVVGTDTGWHLRFAFGNGPRELPLVESRATVPVGAWSHVAVTYDDARRSALFWIDGVASGAGTMPTQHTTTTEPREIVLANFANADATHWVDEVRVSYVRRYIAPFVPPLWTDPDVATVALWHFDEGEGTEIADAAGGGTASASSVAWSWRSTCDLRPIP